MHSDPVATGRAPRGGTDDIEEHEFRRDDADRTAGAMTTSRVRVVTTEEPSRLATGCAIAMAIPLVLLVIITILGGLKILLEMLLG